MIETIGDSATAGPAHTLRQRLAAYIRLMRPFTMLAPGIGFLCAALLATGAAQITLNWHSWKLILIGMAAAALLNGASNSFNQVFDLEIDRINQPMRPLPQGKFSRSHAFGFSLVLYVIALLMAAQLSRLSLAMFAAAALCTLVYSAPPVRTKERGWLANLSIAVPRGVLLVIAGWFAVGATAMLDLWIIALIFGLFIFGASSTKDLADIEGDRAYGCRTLPVMYGAERAVWLMAPFIVTPWLLLAVANLAGLLTANRWVLLSVSVVLAVWGLWVVQLMLRTARSKADASPRAAWVQMYLLMMFAQVGLVAAYLLS